VLQAGARAKHLVQQILAFSRQTEVEHTPMKLHLLVQEALGLIRGILPTTLTLRQDVDQDVGTVLISISEVHQILMNLCANAAYAVREAGGGPPGVRAIGLPLEGGRSQVSTNVHDPIAVPLRMIVARVAELAAEQGARPVEAEIVGLVPAAALQGFPPELPIRDFDPERHVIERRLSSSR